MPIRRQIAIALLAAALGACADPEQPPTASVLPDSADQVAYGFRKFITVEGVQRVELEADSAFHYPQREEWELYVLEVQFYSVLGERRSTLTARQGTYDWRTGNMEARDSVVAVTPDGRRLTTCAITYSQDHDEITGPCAFVYDAPGEHLTGDSFIADPDFREVEGTTLAGSVREPGSG